MFSILYFGSPHFSVACVEYIVSFDDMFLCYLFQYDVYVSLVTLRKNKRETRLYCLLLRDDILYHSCTKSVMSGTSDNFYTVHYMIFSAVYI